MTHLHRLARVVAALTLCGCASAVAPADTAALLRGGRLADACQRAFFEGPAARDVFDAEVRRRAGVRLSLRVLEGPGEPEPASQELPPLRFGRLAAMTVTSTPSGDASSVYAEVDAPTLEALDDANPRQTSWQLARAMSPALAHLMVTGSELPGSGQTPRVVLDALALMLSAGMVDPRLRDSPPPPPPPRAPLPAPVQALLSRFREPLRCATTAATRCDRLLPLLPDAGRREPTHLVVEARWFFSSQAASCEQRRVVALALPPGVDLAARVRALFARGPVDLATAPAVSR